MTRLTLFNRLARTFGDVVVFVDVTGSYYFSINCPDNNLQGLELIKNYKDDDNVCVGTNYHGTKVISIRIKDLDKETYADLWLFVIEFLGYH